MLIFAKKLIKETPEFFWFQFPDICLKMMVDD
jgi:hypothetical protein